MFQRIKFLRDKYNFEPSVIYDIGSHEGKWTEECKKIYPKSQFIQFEANTNKKQLTPDAHFEVLSSEDNNPIKYYKTTSACDTGNSVYRENTVYFEDFLVQVEERKSRKLDTIVTEKKLDLPDFMKIDTQGSELDILKGATNTMKNAQVILMEISLHQYNKDSPLLHTVIVEMLNYGYIMFDIVDLHYNNAVLIQIDALFCKKDSKFIVKNF